VGCLLVASSVHAADQSRLNVLFIAIDDLRAQLGCYGDPEVRSPCLDRLSQQGTLFERAYCQQAVCNPSRASLLTGMRLRTLEIWDLPTHFRQRFPNVVTLPQHFKQCGYHTENIGKIFHNWRQDDFRGDAPSWSVPAVMHYATHGTDQAEVEGSLPPDLVTTPKCECRDVPDEAYRDGRVAEAAVAALERLQPRATKQPFFLAVGFWKPHSHFNAPKRYWDLYERDDVSLPEQTTWPSGAPEIALHDGREILSAFRDRPGGVPTTEETRTLRHGYLAAISYVDAQVGKVVNGLDRLGLRESTVIVIWSDHGFHLGEQGLWAKTSNYELDARVPLIILTPNQAARRSSAIVELLDLYPTLTDLCGLETPHHVEGISLRPLVEGTAETVKDYATTQHPRPAYPAKGMPPEVMGYSYRTSRYRMTEWVDFKSQQPVAHELYDYDRDPDETQNVYYDPRYQKTRERLEAMLQPQSARQ